MNIKLIMKKPMVESELLKFQSIRICLASPHRIKQWAKESNNFKGDNNSNKTGQVVNAKTFNYKTLKPEKGGLFCENIFGSLKNIQSRRYKLGYIQLISPVIHVWYLKGSTSYLSIILNMKKKKLEAITYCSEILSTHLKSVKSELTKDNIYPLVLTENTWIIKYLQKLSMESFFSNVSGKDRKSFVQIENSNIKIANDTFKDLEDFYNVLNTKNKYQFVQKKFNAKKRTSFVIKLKKQWTNLLTFEKSTLKYFPLPFVDSMLYSKNKDFTYSVKKDFDPNIDKELKLKNRSSVKNNELEFNSFHVQDYYSDFPLFLVLKNSNLQEYFKIKKIKRESETFLSNQRQVKLASKINTTALDFLKLITPQLKLLDYVTLFNLFYPSFDNEQTRLNFPIFQNCPLLLGPSMQMSRSNEQNKDPKVEGDQVVPTLLFDSKAREQSSMNKDSLNANENYLYLPFIQHLEKRIGNFLEFNIFAESHTLCEKNLKFRILTYQISDFKAQQRTFIDNSPNYLISQTLLNFYYYLIKKKVIIDFLKDLKSAEDFFLENQVKNKFQISSISNKYIQGPINFSLSTSTPLPKKSLQSKDFKLFLKQEISGGSFSIPKARKDSEYNNTKKANFFSKIHFNFTIKRGFCFSLLTFQTLLKINKTDYLIHQINNIETNKLELKEISKSFLCTNFLFFNDLNSEPSFLISTFETSFEDQRTSLIDLVFKQKRTNTVTKDFKNILLKKSENQPLHVTSKVPSRITKSFLSLYSASSLGEEKNFFQKVNEVQITQSNLVEKLMLTHVLKDSKIGLTTNLKYFKNFQIFLENSLTKKKKENDFTVGKNIINSYVNINGTSFFPLTLNLKLILKQRSWKEKTPKNPLGNKSFRGFLLCELHATINKTLLVGQLKKCLFLQQKIKSTKLLTTQVLNSFLLVTKIKLLMLVLDFYNGAGELTFSLHTLENYLLKISIDKSKTKFLSKLKVLFALNRFSSNNYIFVLEPIFNDQGLDFSLLTLTPVATQSLNSQSILKLYTYGGKQGEGVSGENLDITNLSPFRADQTDKIYARRGQIKNKEFSSEESSKAVHLYTDGVKQGESGSENMNLALIGKSSLNQSDQLKLNQTIYKSTNNNIFKNVKIGTFIQELQTFLLNEKPSCKNKYYTITQSFLWSKQEDWVNFVTYMTATAYRNDRVIPCYVDRSITFDTPLTGALGVKNLLVNLTNPNSTSNPRLDSIKAEKLFKQKACVQKVAARDASGQSLPSGVKKMESTSFPLTFSSRILNFFNYYTRQTKKGYNLVRSPNELIKPTPTIDVLINQMKLKIEILNRRIKDYEDFLKFRTFFMKPNSFETKKDLINKTFSKLKSCRILRAKAFRRLKMLLPFQKLQVLPTWMVLDVLPVLPPDLRPMLVLDNQQVAVSDLNKLYQKIIFRNNRLERLYGDLYGLMFSPEIRYAQRLLQEAVDALIENGKGDAVPITASDNRALKSLSDMIKGKKGRFRQNLLGKRVDYSGRSVIVVGPQLKLYECGLPKEMAIELFQPFLIRRLIAKNLAQNFISAKKLIQSKPKIIWTLLKDIMENRPILLNRAPTLHRLGIQAFKPTLVSGRTILLHPLVCSAYNADFDGDQMAVHVPLSHQACSEAWKLMWGRNNILSPATGEPIIVPSQDMVLGCYYLTMVDKIKQLQLLTKQYNSKDLWTSEYSNPVSTYRFSMIDQVIQLFSQNILQCQTPIWLKWSENIEFEIKKQICLEIQIDKFGNSTKLYSDYQLYFNKKQNSVSFYIKTTPGRVYINKVIAETIFEK